MRSKQKIYINPVGTVRPCNKLPTVQCRIGHRCTLFKRVILSGVSRYCNRRAHKSKNRHGVEPFFDRVRRKKANKQLACALRDLQKSYI